MDENVIRHRARHIEFAFGRLCEVEKDIAHSHSSDGAATTCPECGCTMMYRGRARLRNGAIVHHFECVHSYREVYSLSVIAD